MLMIGRERNGSRWWSGPLARACAGLFVVLSGCVTEGRSRPRTMKESTREAVAERSGVGWLASGGAGSSLGASSLGASALGASGGLLLGGPIATPVPPDLSTSARLNFQIRPMGAVDFDGMVLPLVSPDGRFLAVERGDPPSWGTVLAQADASPAVSTTIAVYDLGSESATKQGSKEAVKPASGRLNELSLTESVPRGAVLGRSCDTKGFLIELPRPDGSRWIGRAAWLTGKTTWLVQGETVNAHAAVTSSELLTFTRRSVGAGTASSLVLQSPDGSQRVMGAENGLNGAELSYLFPFFGADGTTLNVLALSGGALEMMTIRVHESGGRAEFGSVLARQQIAANADVALAYQIVAPAQTTLLGRVEKMEAGVMSAEARGAVVYHPGMGRMAEFDWLRGVFVPLAAKSIAAVSSPFVEPGGYFATTPEGLTFMPFPRDDGATTTRRAVLGRMLDVAYVARATRDPARALVLIGPGGKSGSPRIEVMSMSFPATEVEAAGEKSEKKAGG